MADEGTDILIFFFTCHLPFVSVCNNKLMSEVAHAHADDIRHRDNVLHGGFGCGILVVERRASLVVQGQVYGRSTRRRK